MTRQPESRIVSDILKALNALPQTYLRKTHGSRYSASFPDIIGSHRGQAIAIEVKTATGKTTPRQDRELAKWRLAGAKAGVARSVDEALALIGAAQLCAICDDNPSAPGNKACAHCMAEHPLRYASALAGRVTTSPCPGKDLRSYANSIEPPDPA